MIEYFTAQSRALSPRALLLPTILAQSTAISLYGRAFLREMKPAVAVSRCFSRLAILRADDTRHDCFIFQAARYFSAMMRHAATTMAMTPNAWFYAKSAAKCLVTR